MIKPMPSGYLNNAFISTWKTDNAGTSLSNQITIPTVSTGTYDCRVYWGDGTFDTINTYNNAAWTHTYSVAGTYTVSILGTFVGISFNNGGDCLKILNISNWGGMGFGVEQGRFFGCTNMTITAIDNPVIVSGTSMISGFRNCASITTIPSITSWNWRAITDISILFQGCSNFNQDLNGMDVSNVTRFWASMVQLLNFRGNVEKWDVSKGNDFLNMFSGSTLINQNFGSWNMGNATNASGMFTSITLSTANYNALLAGWASLPTLKTNVTFSGGNSKYDSSSGGFDGTAGRAILTGTYGWNISDGGPA